MKTTRQRIIEFLENKIIATPNEISAALHMTTANARHHLRILVDEGVIILTGQTKSGVRGRPESLYRLDKPALAHNLNRLASGLIQSIVFDLDGVAKEDFFRNLAKYLIDASDLVPDMPLGGKLQLVVKKLKEMNYKARWEARAQNPRIIFEHCPYFAIIDQQPELCLMDEALISHLIGANVELIAKLRVVRPGLRQCIMQIGNVKKMERILPVVAYSINP